MRQLTGLTPAGFAAGLGEQPDTPAPGGGLAGTLFNQIGQDRLLQLMAMGKQYGFDKVPGLDSLYEAFGSSLGAYMPEPKLPPMANDPSYPQAAPKMYGMTPEGRPMSEGETVVPKTEPVKTEPIKAEPLKATASLKVDMDNLVKLPAAKAAQAATLDWKGKTAVIQDANDLGFMSDNVVVTDRKGKKKNPEKILNSVKTPVISKQDLVDVLSYMKMGGASGG